MKLRQMLVQARPYRPALLLASTLMLMESACALLIPWLAVQFADELLLQALTLDLLLLAMLLVFALQAFLRFANNMVSGQLVLKIGADLRTRLYDHLQALPLTFFQSRKQGDVLAMLTHEADMLSGFIGHTLLGVPSALFTAVGSVVAMVLLDPDFGLLVALLVPLFYLVLRILGRRIRPLAHALQREYANLIAMLDENLGVLPAIKVFTRESQESMRHVQQTQKLLELGRKQNVIHALLEPVLYFLGAAAVLALLWLASDQVTGNIMSPGELVGFLMYAVLLTRPVSSLAGLYGQVHTARGSLTRLQEVIEEPAEHSGTLRPADASLGALQLEQVCFGYSGGRQVLHKLDLAVKVGETVAITGANGSGKSTLLHLLLRLQVPDSGRILLDGVDTASLDLQWLRSQIAVVSQQVLLLNDSIKANIRFARATATDEEVVQVAKLAQLHEFIASLPDAYDTVVGDKGMRLSGGQRQRLALARALLKHAPILVLDEATAMFDPAGELALIDACRQMLATRTVILVTHRPASLSLADRTLLLHEGCLHDVLPGS